MARHTHSVHWTAWAGLIVAAAVILGGINFLQTGNPLKFAITNTGSSVSFSGSCPAVPTAGFPKLQVQALVENSVTGVPDQAVTGLNVISQGTVAATAASTASGYAYFNGTIPCGGSFQILAGVNTNGGVYAGLTNVTRASGNYTTVKVQNLVYAGAPASILFANQTSFGQTKVITNGPVATSTNVQATETIVGASNANFGSAQGALVWASFNSVAVNSCTASGTGFALQTPTPSASAGYGFPTSVNTPNSNYIRQVYLIPGGIKAGTTYTLNWNCKTSSSFAANTMVNFGLNDVVLLLNNGNVTSQTTNPISNADLGLSLINQGGTTEPTVAAAPITGNVIGGLGIRFA